MQTIDILDAKGLTPLQIAVRCDNKQAVKTLVDLGADVSKVTADGEDAAEFERLMRESDKESEDTVS